MPELLDLAEQVVGWADDGEQVEVVAVHERETEVRAYQGEVEALTVAESQGVGIRVVRDGRQGFAHAGTLDLDVLAETLAEARDNVAFATPDEWCALAEPDGVAHADLDLYRQSLADHPTDAKVEAALDLERRTAAADPRIIGVESAEYADAVAESAVVTQTGFGFSIGRAPGDLDPGRASADAVERATRLLGAVKPPSTRLTVVLDPWVSAQFLGIVGSTLNGESVLKGRSLFADRVGRTTLTMGPMAVSGAFALIASVHGDGGASSSSPPSGASVNRHSVTSVAAGA